LLKIYKGSVPPQFSSVVIREKIEEARLQHQFNLIDLTLHYIKRNGRQWRRKRSRMDRKHVCMHLDTTESCLEMYWNSPQRKGGSTHTLLMYSHILHTLLIRSHTLCIRYSYARVRYSYATHTLTYATHTVVNATLTDRRR